VTEADYKAWTASWLMELCPEGIDIFFDNVGGDILDVALARLAMRGRRLCQSNGQSSA